MKPKRKSRTHKIRNVDRAPVIPQVSESGQWYCLSVRPGWMARVEGELYMLGYRTFTPKQRKWVCHARRRTAVYRPILTRYLFVDVDHPRQSFDAARVRGVEDFLKSEGNPLPFSFKDVAMFIERQLLGEWDDISKDKLPVGAKIVFMDGPHENVEATITNYVKGNQVGYKIIGTAKYGKAYTHAVRAA